MIVLFYSCKIPVPRKKSIPFFASHFRKLFYFFCGLWWIAKFFENQDELVIQFKDPISWVRIGPHLNATPCCIRCRYFLPDNCPHVIKANILTELYYFFSNRYYFITSVINSPGKLVTDIYTKPATIMQYPVAFFPYEI